MQELARALSVVSLVLAGCGVAPAGSDGDAPDAAIVADGPADAGAAVACADRWTGAVQLGTAADDEALAVALGARGEIVIGGFEHGVVGVTNIEPDGDAAGYVAAYDPAGAPAWKVAVDTAGTDTVEAVAVARDGGVVFAGRTSGAIAGAVNQGQFDALVGGLGRDGAIGPRLQLGTERPEHPTHVGLDAAGRVVIAGFDDVYIPSNYVAAWEDGLAASVELGAAGGPRAIFSWRADSKPNDRLTGLAVDADGSIFVSGVASSGPDRGTFVRKLDATGAIVWTRSISRSGVDLVNAITLSPAGELYAAGATGQTLGARSFGQQDAFLIALDKATGAIRRVTQAGSTESDWPTAVAVDREGTATIVGATLGTIDPDHPNQGSEDVFVLTIGGDGAVRSAWQAGTAADEIATGVAVDPCGRAVVVGYTDGALFGPGRRRDGFLLARRP